MAETLIFSTGSAIISGTLSSTASISQLNLDGVSGSFTGSFEGKIPSESRVYHELVDDGAQSSSFTMSWANTNFRKITPGASIGIDFNGLAAGQEVTLEVDNGGNHNVTLPGSSSLLLWEFGITSSFTTGSNVLKLTELSIGTFAEIKNNIL